MRETPCSIADRRSCSCGHDLDRSCLSPGMTHPSIWLLGATAIACSSATYHAPATTTAITLPAPGANAVAIVRISAPWYARNFLIRRRFRAAVGDYERLPGLLRKYFT